MMMLQEQLIFYVEGVGQISGGFRGGVMEPQMNDVRRETAGMQRKMLGSWKQYSGREYCFHVPGISFRIRLLSRIFPGRSGGRNDRPGALVLPFQKNFWIFPKKAERKNKFTLPRMVSKSDFFLKWPTPYKILDPLLERMCVWVSVQVGIVFIFYQ